MYKLHLGNCLEVMKTMADNSVDSIVTDPPYGLSFMGKKWDYDVPSIEIWSEALRVLKPGGHLLAFSGARTYHRMVVKIEDAGFEIRDQIMWLYGCLSEDTQIVTPYGNKPYTAIKTGDLVLCYDKYNKEYSYQAVEEIYEYNIKDTAYRIQSDYTDQIVSRNHRCLVERDGREVFVYAEALQQQENIPFLEDLSSLQSTLSNSHKIAGTKKQNLFQRMQESTNWTKKFWWVATRKAFWYGTSSLFSLWNYLLPQQKAFGTSGESSMFSSMQWSYSWEGVEATCPQRKEKLETRIRAGICGKNVWGGESKLEGWNYLQTTKGKLQRSEVYSLPIGIFGYGTKRWLHNGTSFVGSTADGKVIDSNRSGASYQSRSIGQSYRKSDAVRKQQRSQTIREWTGHKTTLATVTPFEYDGKIWCVKVPTGSFVAVRNGKVFTTGNSGFPKSLNVSKAIDKKLGTEREVVSEIKTNSGGYAHISKTNAEQGFRPSAYKGHSEDDDAANVIKITKPASEQAAQWEGWGTALKPAHEPIVVARKPLAEKSVAENVLKYGVGGINIDDCRTAINPEIDKRLGGNGTWKAKKGAKNVYGNFTGNGIIKSSEKGRFPANVIHDGSEEVVKRFPNTKAGGNVSGKEPSHTGDENTNCYGKYNRVSWDSYADNGSAARFFYCAKTSKKDRDEGLENTKSYQYRQNGFSSTISDTKLPRSNNHPTVKPTELMKYLCRLVTPKGGTVLDPFMGSGSTGKAAIIEGFDFIGIEMEQEYLDIAEKRIQDAEPKHDSVMSIIDDEDNIS